MKLSLLTISVFRALFDLWGEKAGANVFCTRGVKYSLHTIPASWVSILSNKEVVFVAIAQQIFIMCLIMLIEHDVGE